MKRRVLLGAIVLASALFACSLFVIIDEGSRTFQVEGDSMAPTLQDGELLEAREIKGDIARFDVVVYRPPYDEEVVNVGRIIGLPGERVVVARSGDVFIDGRPIHEPHLATKGTTSSGPVLLGPTEYFILGDNRDDSSDSRHWGPVVRNDIESLVDVE